MTRMIGLLLALCILVGCGGGASATARRRSGPDVVSAEWTSGDDAVLPGAEATGSDDAGR